METTPQRRLDVFSRWLKALPADVAGLAHVLGAHEPEPVRVNVVAALIYLTRNLDLIPDGIAGIGYLDDAFVLRTASALAIEGLGGAGPAVLRRLARDDEFVSDFLGPDHKRFVAYVVQLREHVSKGRTPVQIASNRELMNGLIAEANAWSAEYKESPLKQEPAELDRLQTFLRAKLAVVRV